MYVSTIKKQYEKYSEVRETAAHYKKKVQNLKKSPTFEQET